MNSTQAEAKMTKVISRTCQRHIFVFCQRHQLLVDAITSLIWHLGDSHKEHFDQGELHSGYDQCDVGSF